MTSIQVEPRNNAGPYAYRVHGSDHPDANPSGQYWEYIGPVGKIDPSDLTEEEARALRENDVPLARFRDSVEANLHYRHLANGIRDDLIDEFGEDVLSPTDDRRENMVKLAEDAPPDAIDYLSEQAADIQSEVGDKIGQAPLTDDEIKNIDFERDNANVPHARAAKAALLDAGISNWTDYYTPEDHPDPHAHADDQEQSKEQAARTDAPSPGDRRLDNEGSGLASVDISGAFDRARQFQQEQAKEVADAYADGTDKAEAEAYLKEELDVTDDANLDAIEEHGADALEL